ncbi:MAG: calcium-binding protein [Rickettsiales bacterium]|nr:calcium-binding protein [Rickettsiales bacterium]
MEQNTIVDVRSLPSEIDKIQFSDPSISASSIRLMRNNDDLIIYVNGDEKTITITNHFMGSDGTYIYQIEQIVFSDGTVMDLTAGLEFTGTNGSETIRGTKFSDTIKGLGGSDTILSYGGDDTIITSAPGVSTIIDSSGFDTYEFTLSEMGRNNIIDIGGNGCILIHTTTQTVGVSGTASYLTDSNGVSIEGKWSLLYSNGLSLLLERGTESYGSFIISSTSGSSLRITPNGDYSKYIIVKNCDHLFSSRGKGVANVGDQFLGIILPGIDCDALQIPTSCETENDFQTYISLGQEIISKCIGNAEELTESCLNRDQDELAEEIESMLSSLTDAEKAVLVRRYDPLVLDLNGTLTEYPYVLDTMFLTLSRGYGNVEPLHIAMSRNSALLEDVRKIAKSVFENQDEEAVLHLATLDEKIEYIIYEWADVIGITGMRGSFDARKLATLEAFRGVDYYNVISGVNPTSEQVSLLNAAWESLVCEVRSKILIQGTFREAFPGATYDFRTDSINFGNVTAVEFFGNIKAYCDNCLVGTDKTHFTYQVKQMLPYFVGKINGIDTVAQAKTMLTDYVGKVSDYLVAGTDGDDALVGTFGTDILDPRTGTDTAVGGYGDDIYVYNVGDGHDTYGEASLSGSTYTDSYGSDRIIFGAGITRDNIIFQMSGSNLIIKFLDENGEIKADDSVTIISQFGALSNRIETLEFTDSSITDEANRTMDISDPNKIILRSDDSIIFRSGITSSNVALIREGDNLVVLTSNFDNKVVVHNYFTTNPEGVSYIKFSDNSVFNLSSVNITAGSSDVYSLNGYAPVQEDVSTQIHFLNPSIVQITNATSPGNGTVSIGDNGELVYQTSENYNGADSFEITYIDALGVTKTKTMNVVAAPVNDAPTIAVGQEELSETIQTNAKLEIDPFVGVSDVDGDELEVASITRINDEGVQETIDLVVDEESGNSQEIVLKYGTIQLVTSSVESSESEDGEYRETLVYTPNGAHSGIESFSYKIDDGNGGEVTRLVNVNVSSILPQIDFDELEDPINMVVATEEEELPETDFRYSIYNVSDYTGDITCIYPTDLEHYGELIEVGSDGWKAILRIPEGLEATPNCTIMGIPVNGTAGDYSLPFQIRSTSEYSDIAQLRLRIMPRVDFSSSSSDATSSRKSSSSSRSGSSSSRDSGVWSSREDSGSSDALSSRDSSSSIRESSIDDDIWSSMGGSSSSRDSSISRAIWSSSSSISPYSSLPISSDLASRLGESSSDQPESQGVSSIATGLMIVTGAIVVVGAIAGGIWLFKKIFGKEEKPKVVNPNVTVDVENGTTDVEMDVVSTTSFVGQVSASKGDVSEQNQR